MKTSRFVWHVARVHRTWPNGKPVEWLQAHSHGSDWDRTFDGDKRTRRTYRTRYGAFLAKWKQLESFERHGWSVKVYRRRVAA